MQVKIEPSWAQHLASEFEQPYFKKLTDFVRSEYQNHTCFPPAHQLFAAFDHTPFDQVKVVLLGQDPYHGHRQAHGLCFSVNDSVPHPPSLQNIFKEIHRDLGKPIPTSGNLQRWALQGVLLLNATLTVRSGLAGSHQNQGWETFTDCVIETLSRKRKNLVFLLWGGYAKKKIRLIDTQKHKVLTSGHPSPFSANKGHWFGNNHFSQTNSYLKESGQSSIDW